MNWLDLTLRIASNLVWLTVGWYAARRRYRGYRIVELHDVARTGVITVEGVISPEQVEQFKAAFYANRNTAQPQAGAD